MLVALTSDITRLAPYMANLKKVVYLNLTISFKGQAHTLNRSRVRNVTVTLLLRHTDRLLLENFAC